MCVQISVASSAKALLILSQLRPAYRASCQLVVTILRCEVSTKYPSDGTNSQAVRRTVIKKIIQNVTIIAGMIFNNFLTDSPRQSFRKYTKG